ncbi:MAG TPA: hypothetical protein IAC12_05425 [Candidatus Aphodovivens avistercoris]|nr:hypothetical protein [Candidatus Aphodovivens avistercoris]
MAQQICASQRGYGPNVSNRGPARFNLASTMLPTQVEHVTSYETLEGYGTPTRQNKPPASVAQRRETKQKERKREEERRSKQDRTSKPINKTSNEAKKRKQPSSAAKEHAANASKRQP